MKLYGPDGGELMQITRLERDGGRLVLKGKVFGSMPISARLTPHEARSGFKLLNLRLLPFLVTFLFRKGDS
jgi:hypothetical protein